MKNLFFSITFLLCCSLSAQDTILYKHNNLPANNWEETTIYAVVNYNIDLIGADVVKYWENGVKISETSFSDYENNIKEGERKQWHSENQLASIANFKDGNLTDTLRRFDRQGFLYFEAIYENGEVLSDTTYENPDTDKDKELFTVVESMPIFPGCATKATNKERSDCSNQAIFTHIGKNTKYPGDARDAGISGVVYVSYEVNDEGYVENARIIRGIQGGELLEEEALRVIKLLPKMIPGTQFGEYVKVNYNVPIRFKLTSGKQKKKRRR